MYMSASSDSTSKAQKMVLWRMLGKSSAKVRKFFLRKKWGPCQEKSKHDHQVKSCVSFVGHSCFMFQFVSVSDGLEAWIDEQLSAHQEKLPGSAPVCHLAQVATTF